MDPVDAYAAALRETFLRPGARLRSNQHEVVVRQQSRRLFQKDLLPAEVLKEPRYWVEATGAIVTVRSMESHVKSLKNND